MADLCQSLGANVIDEVRRTSKNSERYSRLIYVRLGERRTGGLCTSIIVLTIKCRYSLQIDLTTGSPKCESAGSGCMAAVNSLNINGLRNNLVDGRVVAAEGESAS